MADLGYTRYHEQEERAEFAACIEHRRRNGLPVEGIIIEEIDCEEQCEARGTCPHNQLIQKRSVS